MISRWHLAAVLALVGMIIVPITVLAVVTCPYGIVNDPYPGECPRYTDADQNGICDISETDTGQDPVTTVPVTVPVSPYSSPSGSGSNRLNQTDDNNDEDDHGGEREDDEGSRNRERNRNGQSSGDVQVSDTGTGFAAALTAVSGLVSTSPTVVNPAVRPAIAQVAVPCPYGIVNDPYPGQCRRYVDANRDGFCDLSVPGTAVSAATPTVPVTPCQTVANPTLIPTLVSAVCPYGIVNDPYPGKCPAYLDADNDTLCDLSQEPACGNVVLPATACPFGKVNDPYPGECAKYVDLNINGLCDYSENGTGGDAGSADTGDGSGSVPPTGLLAAGMGAGCIVIGYSFGRGKK
jgi:hypothetical protein